MAGQFIGLDAAHVRWWAAAGPDTVDNGLCLCGLHHKLFDSGALSINDEYRVIVSREFIASNAIAEALVYRYAGAQLLDPQSSDPKVDQNHLGWHRREVFRGPARVYPLDGAESGDSRTASNEVHIDDRDSWLGVAWTPPFTT
jgi:putative restriction endonuclease